MMFHDNDIHEIRKMYFSSWKKYKQKHPLQPLEQQIVEVILDHPEYQPLFDNAYRNQDFAIIESNPFLHLGLHLAIRDQIKTDRPLGITAIYLKLLKIYYDKIKVEHMMIEVLSAFLWHAQSSGLPPNEKDYLNHLLELL